MQMMYFCVLRTTVRSRVDRSGIYQSGVCLLLLVGFVVLLLGGNTADPASWF